MQFYSFSQAFLSTGIGSRTATGEMEPKTLPLPQALLRAPVPELARMLEQAFELQLNLSKRGQLGMQPTIVGSESTGEPATYTFASGFNACSRTWTKYRSAPRDLATESAA